jgi:hypothetical protein
MNKKPIKEFRWREGSHHKVEAKVAAAEVQALLDKKGDKVEASDVLASAASPRSPLHPEFEWDDTKAAREHRLLQARNLLNAIKVIYVTVEHGEPKSIEYSFVSAIQNTDEGGQAHYYISTEEGLKKPDQRAEMLENALSELRAFRRKYAVLTELASVFAAIDKTTK